MFLNVFFYLTEIRVRRIGISHPCFFDLLKKIARKARIMFINFDYSKTVIPRDSWAKVLVIMKDDARKKLLS